MKKTKRLRKLAEYHDYKDRTCAIALINNEIFEAYEHWDAIKKYFIDNYNINGSSSEIEDKIDDILREKDSDIVIENYAMANKVDDNNTIYIVAESLKNISLPEFTTKLYNQYPNYDISIDSVMEDECPF